MTFVAMAVSFQSPCNVILVCLTFAVLLALAHTSAAVTCRGRRRFYGVHCCWVTFWGQGLLCCAWVSLCQCVEGWETPGCTVARLAGGTVQLPVPGCGTGSESHSRTLRWPLSADQPANGTGSLLRVPRYLLCFSFPGPLAKESGLSLFVFSSRTVGPACRLLECLVCDMWEIKKNHGTRCDVIQVLKSSRWLSLFLLSESFYYYLLNYFQSFQLYLEGRSQEK